MFKNIREVTVDELKKHCTLIHYFGLGFIQIKLGPEYRIHIYTSLLPPIVGLEEVHNHRYDFHSTLLSGSLRQEIYKHIPGEDMQIEEESCAEGYVPAHAPIPCSIHLLTTQDFKAGSSYSINHQTLHRIEAKEAATLLRRGAYKKELAEVVRPRGAAKICPFGKKIPEQELWKITEEFLKRAHKNRVEV